MCEALLAIGGSVLAVSEPIAGLALVLVATVSAFADLLAAIPLVRRLLGRRASQNVLSAEGGEKPGVLVLTAHYDAGRGGTLFSARALRRRARIGAALRRPLGPYEGFFWALFAVLVCTALRVFDLDGTVLTAVQYVPTVILIAYVPLLADTAVSAVSPGANDNASGVATVLRLAERHGGRLEHFDVWVLLTGAGGGLPLGMRQFLRAHRDELDPVTTAFLCVERAGDGDPHHVEREGNLLTTAYHPSLRELCDELGLPALRSRTPTDVQLARGRGYPAIAITASDETGYSPGFGQPSDSLAQLDPEALEETFERCSELVGLIDQRIGPRLGSADR